MNLGQSIRIALGMLFLHKLRAFLTMLGVIIGVMSVTMIIMISNGFQAYINGEFKKLGADTMFVFFDPGRRQRGQSIGEVEGLRNEDLDYLMTHVPLLEVGCGLMSVPSQKVRYGTNEFPNPEITSTDANFLVLNRFKILEGRGLTEDDIRSRSNVCMIGESVRNKLFPDKQSLGKMVLLNGIALEVIGVIESNNFMGNNTERYLLVPLTTAQDKWIGGDRLDIIMLRAQNGVKAEEAMDAVWRALMVRTNNKPIYRVDSNESIMKVFGGIIGGAGGILAAVAALSLLVGGIGIMNIMLVSVTERTKEIGLRKAVGAKRGAILTQFLVEAATLSLVGGLIGMTIAYGLGQVVAMVAKSQSFPNPQGLSMPFPLTAAIFAAAFSAFIGVVFGLYPAMSASRLDPIVALRRE
ncbi:MAG: ABC transporter permease [Fimbriimonas sp.]